MRAQVNDAVALPKQLLRNSRGRVPGVVIRIASVDLAHFGQDHPGDGLVLRNRVLESEAGVFNVLPERTDSLFIIRQPARPDRVGSKHLGEIGPRSKLGRVALRLTRESDEKPLASAVAATVDSRRFRTRSWSCFPFRLCGWHYPVPFV